MKLKLDTLDIRDLEGYHLTEDMDQVAAWLWMWGLEELDLTAAITHATCPGSLRSQRAARLRAHAMFYLAHLPIGQERTDPWNPLRGRGACGTTVLSSVAGPEGAR